MEKEKEESRIGVRISLGMRQFLEESVSQGKFKNISAAARFAIWKGIVSAHVGENHGKERTV